MNNVNIHDVDTHDITLQSAIRDILDNHSVVVEAQRIWEAPFPTPAARNRAKAMPASWAENLEYQLTFLASKHVPDPSLLVYGSLPVSFYPVPSTFHLLAPINTALRSWRFQTGHQHPSWVPPPQAPVSLAPQFRGASSVPSAESGDDSFATPVVCEQISDSSATATDGAAATALMPDGTSIPVYVV